MIGETSVEMGAGRARKEDIIDYGVGMVIHRKVGDHVINGDPMFTLYASSQESLDHARERVLSAFEYSESPVERLPLFYEVIQ